MTTATLIEIESRAIDLEINSDMTALEVLQQVCKEFSLDFAEFELELSGIGALDISGVLGYLEAGII